MELNYAEKIEKLTRKLVSIRSVCDEKDGESKVSEYIAGYFLKLDYFRKHPHQVTRFDCGKGRHSTIAYIKGKGSRTIILMGHIDTVGVEDYGRIAGLATDTLKLPDALKKNFSLPDEVKKDMDSGNFLFGRGALDMKAGVAAYMVIFEHFAKHPDELNGNLLFLCECDEEGNSQGVIKALDVIKEIGDREGFRYAACINGDYSTADDDKRHVYLGTVGKLLPCFVAIGKESHVGDPFAAVDPNLLLSFINRNMSLNMDLADKGQGKTAVPPVTLKQSDNKDSYTVQTALAGISYFNYMTYGSSPKKVMNNCLKAARDSFREALDLIDDNYRRYCHANGLQYRKPPHKPLVYSFEEWNRMLERDPAYVKGIRDYAKKLLKEDPDIDMRDYTFKLILRSYEYYEEKKPVIIVCFGSMFYSSVRTTDRKLIAAVDKAVKTVNEDSVYDISSEYFYPYISDMSFMAVPFMEKDIMSMLANSPYPL
ncbi:MAG: M20/M25/M40 family metallo-hydrolase, partial [Erysipelotrichaceae bacterium]|nr:M20/M25/M40 family metallo-hydrolase [Erysipelotrichaceae bacterium]